MSVETIIAREGDTVDLIAFRRFGRHGMEAAILEANSGLAALGPILPMGTAVIIPTPEVKARQNVQQLWGIAE